MYTSRALTLEYAYYSSPPSTPRPSSCTSPKGGKKWAGESCSLFRICRKLAQDDNLCSPHLIKFNLLAVHPVVHKHTQTDCNKLEQKERKT